MGDDVVVGLDDVIGCGEAGGKLVFELFEFSFFGKAFFMVSKADSWAGDGSTDDSSSLEVLSSALAGLFGRLRFDMVEFQNLFVT